MLKIHVCDELNRVKDKYKLSLTDIANVIGLTNHASSFHLINLSENNRPHGYKKFAEMYLDYAIENDVYPLKNKQRNFRTDTKKDVIKWIKIK